MNQEYNNYFLYPKQPTSVRDVYEMSKQRNPIIETDKNIEKVLNEHVKQSQLLNNVLEITNKNALEINNIVKQMQKTQEITNRQFNISLFVSIVVGLLAAGSFILTLIQFLLK